MASHWLEETEATINIAMMTGGGDTPNKPFVDMQTLNQVREIVSRLFNQSKILNECRVRVAQAIGKSYLSAAPSFSSHLLLTSLTSPRQLRLGIGRSR